MRELEDLIDDTARRLTDGAPSPALRVHVRRHVGSRTLPGRAWRSPLAAGAAVTIVLSVLAARVWLVDGQPGPLEARNELRRDLTLAVPATPRSADAAAVRTARPVVATRRVSPAPLPVVTPIAINPMDRLPLLDPGMVEVELVEVPMPLRADRVEIEPLVIE